MPQLRSAGSAPTVSVFHFFALTALAGVVVSAACGGGAPAGNGAAGGGRGGGGGVPVEAVTIAETPVEQTGEYVGTIRSRNSVTVQPQVEGFLTRIAVKSGDRVAAGAVLFEVDSAPQQAALANIQSQRAVRETDAALAKQQATRAQALLKVGAASQQDVEQADARLAAAEAQLKAVDEQIRQSRAELGYFRVTAPTAGVVGDVPVRLGDRVTKSTELTTLDANTGLEIYINIPVQEAPKAAMGVPVRLLSDRGEVLATEKISFLSPAVDERNQTVLAKAQLSKPAGFRTEQFVRTQVVYSSAPGVRVPVVAALRINGQYFVYLVGQGNGMTVAKQTAIQVGPVVDNEYVVTSGLKSGDQVIVSGIQKIGDGAPVTVMPASAGRQGGK